MTSDGRVYEWGKIYFPNQWKPLTPRFISGHLDGRKVTHVACGRVHTLILTLEGELYSWGYNGSGQIGNGSSVTYTDPVKISGLNGFDKKIVSLSCGGWTSFALDYEGNVIAKNFNEFVICGINIGDFLSYFIIGYRRFGLGGITHMEHWG